MPKISEFFGLFIYMYWMDVQKHKTPHFHVRYQGREAVYSLSGELLDGNLGARANRLIIEWTSENKGEIEKAWAAAIAGKELPWIQPLQ